MVMEAYTPGQTFIEPGFFFTQQNVGGIAQAASQNGLLGLVFASNDGPINTPMAFQTEAAFAAIFGPGGKYAAQVGGLGAVQQAWRETPNTVWAVRVGGTGGAAATFLMVNTAAPGVGFTFTPAWVGTGPNSWTATIRNTPDGLQRQFLLYAADGTVLIDARCAIAPTTTGGKGEAGAMVAAINALASVYGTAAVTGSSADTSTLVNAVSQAPTTSGTNPTTATGDYTTAINALSNTFLNAIATDSVGQTVAAALQAWVDTQRSFGMFVVGFTGEAIATSRSTRLTDAKAFNDPAMGYVLNDYYDAYGHQQGANVAMRVAARYAAMGVTDGLPNYVIKGAGASAPAAGPIGDPVTIPDWRTAILAGAIVFRTNQNGQVVIANDTTTFLTPNQQFDKGWQQFHRVKVRDAFMAQVANTIAPVVGQIGNNNPDNRTMIVLAINDAIQAFLRLGVFVPPQGTQAAQNTLVNAALINTAFEDPDHLPSGGSAWFKAICLDAATLDHIYFSVGWMY